MANTLATATLLLLLSQPVQGAAFVATPTVHKKFTCIGIDSQEKAKETTLGQLYSSIDGNHNDSPDTDLTNNIIDDRRNFIKSVVSMGLVASIPTGAIAEDVSAAATALSSPVQVVASGDAKKLFTEGRALEAQGNILAAQRLYIKVTKISPRFIYGWANLSNTLVAQGELNDADQTYTKAINLCEENLKEAEESFGVKRCDDLYLLLLNRGSVRLNNGMPKEALSDLQRANTLRARPDAIILQNLARAQELNSFYAQSDKSYTTAISMTANEVNPFWLRSSMVKYQLGDVSGAMDLMKRVENRFPEAPEVRAAYAVLLLAKGDEDAARKKFLEIPDRQRVKYADVQFLDKVVAWPSAMKEGISTLTKAVGDSS
jgi:Tfp pilus assembly protein PilF